MRIGLQLYTLRRDPAPRPALLEHAAALGVESVEGYGIDLAGADRLALARDLRAEVEGGGLWVSPLHRPLPAGTGGRCFEALVETGATTLVLPTTEALGGFARDALDDPEGVARYA